MSKFHRARRVGKKLQDPDPLCRALMKGLKLRYVPKDPPKVRQLFVTASYDVARKIRRHGFEAGIIAAIARLEERANEARDIQESAEVEYIIRDCAEALRRTFDIKLTAAQEKDRERAWVAARSAG